MVIRQIRNVSFIDLFSSSVFEGNGYISTDTLKEILKDQDPLIGMITVPASPFKLITYIQN